jgi:hypothetical protein
MQQAIKSVNNYTRGVLTHLKITQSVGSSVLIITPFVSTIIFTMRQDVCWTPRIIIFRTNNLIKLHQVLVSVSQHYW